MFTARAISDFSGDSFEFTALYKHQFQISVSEAAMPPGWIRTTLNGVCVDTAPDLPITYLQSANDGLVGLVLGLAVDAEGRLLEGTVDLSDAEGNCTTATLEAFIETLAGRYAGVVSCGEDRRFYLDPVGDLSAVYNSGKKIVASTTLFAIDRDFTDNPAIPFALVETEELNYSLGHTRDADVRRQFANHYLDLATFEQVRHWPKDDTDLTSRESEAEISDIMDRMTARLSAIFCEILRKKTCIVPLSGGRDSRCLVACGIPEIHRASTLFGWHFHRTSKWDTQIGAEIAASLKLPYEIAPRILTTPEDKKTYLRRNGFNLFCSALRSLSISESLLGGMVMPRGNVMEVLRASSWRGRQEGQFKIGYALQRLKVGLIRNHPDLRIALKAGLRAWHDSLPECGKLKVYDLLWFEIILTHGQGTRHYGTPNNFVVNPFNDRVCLQLAMQLPLSLRETDNAYDMIIDRVAPQLKEFRYN